MIVKLGILRMIKQKKNNCKVISKLYTLDNFFVPFSTEFKQMRVILSDFRDITSTKRPNQQFRRPEQLKSILPGNYKQKQTASLHRAVNLTTGTVSTEMT